MPCFLSVLDVERGGVAGMVLLVLRVFVIFIAPPKMAASIGKRVKLAQTGSVVPLVAINTVLNSAAKALC